MSHLTAMFLKEIEMSIHALNPAAQEVANTIEDQLKINNQKIEELRVENASLEKTARKIAFASVIDMIIRFGFPIDEVKNKVAEAAIKIKSKETKQRKKAEPKYRNPENPSQTWGGMGNPPKWVKILKELGTLESALIPAV